LASKSKSSVEEQRPNRSYLPELSSDTQTEDIATLEFPDYTDEATRLQSFKYWGGVLPKKELAEAGFYMIARRDVVRCFSCRVVLLDWEKTDNVIDEHRRHSPECSFLKVHFSHNVSISHHSSLGTITSVTESSVEVPISLRSRFDSIQVKSNPNVVEKSKGMPNSMEEPSGIFPLNMRPDSSYDILNESGVVSTEPLGQQNDDYTMMTSLTTLLTTKQSVVS